MASTLEYNSKLKIIEIVHTGHTTEADLTEVTTKGIALSKEHGIFDVLIDASEIELAASLVNIYDLPDKQYVAEDMDRQIRMGLVLPKLPKEKEAARFYENACVNRGWLVMSFQIRDEAINWLCGTDSSSKPDAGDAS